MAKVLDYLGYSNSRYILYNCNEKGRVHTGKSHCGDEVLDKYAYVLPYDVSLSLLKQGQYTMGHLLPTDDYETGKIKSIQKIYMVRELRSGLVSLMRWSQKLNDFAAVGSAREQMALFMKTPRVGTAYYELAVGSVAWTQKRKLPLLCYEDMISAEPAAKVRCAEIIAGVVDCEVSLVLSAIDNALNAQTNTKMNTPSTLSEYWSQEAEDAFVALGFDELNEQLGYSRTWNRT